MPRNRVLSFMSQWGSPTATEAPTPTSPTPTRQLDRQTLSKPPPAIDTAISPSLLQKMDQTSIAPPRSPGMNTPAGTPSRARGDSRAAGRPMSMLQSYVPPQVDVAQDTPPELAPIFSYLNSHSNKLYQEGYFLKLHDLDSRGRPSGDRAWVECFAQLVGTVLSLWDAAALDEAGEDGEVMPTFINLSDASIKMIESLPMSGAQGGSLQNVLSISTAANNRYLLHFNSLNSLTQWTAGIRLAMFEHATLQEAYTGSLIAGKGKYLNNIRVIMERSKFAHEDWARVRFGAGTPWKRCWCVVSPPDEKEYQKAQKVLKKNGAYNRNVVPKGDIKFYDTRKVTKKTRPIATITDAYAAYAIYPQSKPLIEQSTLVKLEGLLTMHTLSASPTEGFVFVMPEVHPAVTGFEMMLRWLFPVWDTFALYGRPQRLVADTLDQRGLMFAMPKDRRYGYLDILDVSGIIHTSGSQGWTERAWRREMKKLTSTRMMNQSDDGPPRQMSQRRNTVSSRNSMLPSRAGGVRFEDGAEAASLSSPPSRTASPLQVGGAEAKYSAPRRTDSAPPGQPVTPNHRRSVSDAQGYQRYTSESPSRASYEADSPGDEESPPEPPKHGGLLGAALGRSRLERVQSESEEPFISTTYDDLQDSATTPMLELAPVASPPAFTHSAGARPAHQPLAPPELRRANSNIDAATLQQMQDASRPVRTPEEDYNGNQQDNRVATTNTAYANRFLGTPADRSQGVMSNENARYGREHGQRLSPIAGSPYIGNESEQFQSMGSRGIPQVDGTAKNSVYGLVPDDGYAAPTASTQSFHSISRKPVPRKALGEGGPRYSGDDRPSFEDARSESSDHSSLRGALIDSDALEQILQYEDRTISMSSHGSRAASDVTPDYASTAPSIKSERKSIEKPRTGKLKTVGNPNLPLQDDPSVARSAAPVTVQGAIVESDLPTVDFGRTYAYKPDSRPGTSGTITPGMMIDRSRSRSGDRLSAAYGRTPPLVSPGADGKRQSYFGTPSTGRISPADVDPTKQPSKSNSVAWTPASGGTSPGGALANQQSLTPEQWVQYRAAMAAQPQQPPPLPRTASSLAQHQRRDSSADLLAQQRKSNSRTPPPFGRKTPEPFVGGRPTSGDWSQQPDRERGTPPSRPGSRGASTHLNFASGEYPAQDRERGTPPSRPHSRGASTYLNQGLLQSTQSKTLTAKEHMHVARVTGTPLISGATDGSNTNNSKQQQHRDFEASPGLVGTLAARQREKEALKEGLRGGLVEHAIRARQQQQAQAEMEAQMQANAQAQQAAQHAAQAYAVQQRIAGGGRPQSAYYGPQQQMMQQQQQVQQGQGGYYPIASPVSQFSPSHTGYMASGSPGAQQSVYGGSQMGWDGMAQSRQQPQQQPHQQHQRTMTMQTQQQQFLQQQQQVLQSPRHSVYGTSYFGVGGVQQQQQQQQQHQSPQQSGGQQWMGRR